MMYLFIYLAGVVGLLYPTSLQIARNMREENVNRRKLDTNDLGLMLYLTISFVILWPIALPAWLLWRMLSGPLLDYFNQRTESEDAAHRRSSL